MLVTIEVVENEVFVVDGSGDRKNTVQSRSLKINAARLIPSGKLGSIPLRRFNLSVIPRFQLAGQLPDTTNACVHIECR